MVAVDLNTGQYKWHFQEVHHDLWDYDGPEPVVLFTLEKDGKQTPAIAHANKNGYYFILDRRDGKPLYDVKEVPVPTDPAWQNASATQPQPATEPLIPQKVEKTGPGEQSAPMWTPPREKPLVMQPGAESGPEWAPSAYSPRTKYSYIPAGGYEPWAYHAIPDSETTLGSTLTDNPSYAATDHYGLFDALDTTTGKLAWQMKVPERVASGVTVAGDLVFFGESNGKFHALDAKTGNDLWVYQSGEKNVGGANGAPAVYVANGIEYVVMAFGGNTQVRSGQNSPPGDALIAFALPQSGQGATNIVTAQPTPVPSGDIPDSALVEPAKEAPPGATEVEVYAHDIHFYPDHLTAKPGQKLAIKLENQEPTDIPHNFYIKLPTGVTGVKGVLRAGQEGYMILTAPTEPGDYSFWCDVGSYRFQGMVGTLTVAAGGAPGMPHTGYSIP